MFFSVFVQVNLQLLVILCIPCTQGSSRMAVALLLYVCLSWPLTWRSLIIAAWSGTSCKFGHLPKFRLAMCCSAFGLCVDLPLSWDALAVLHVSTNIVITGSKSILLSIFICLFIYIRAVQPVATCRQSPYLHKPAIFIVMSLSLWRLMPTAYGARCIRSPHSRYDVILIVTSFTTELATFIVTEVRMLQTPYRI